MMLLLDFAVASVNRSGGKKTHGNHSNNNIESIIRIVPKLQKQQKIPIKSESFNEV